MLMLHGSKVRYQMCAKSDSFSFVRTKKYLDDERSG